MAPTAPAVNHLLFADDNLLLFKASVERSGVVSNLLDTYCGASGQRINDDNSSIYFSKGVPDSVRQEVKDILQVPNENGAFKYLLT